MNKTTLLAIDWLKSKGFNSSDLVTYRDKPMITHIPTNQRYIAKYLYRNKLIFSTYQKNAIDNDTTILVFDSHDRLVESFIWKDKSKTKYQIMVCDYRLPQVEYSMIKGVLICKEVETEMNQYMNMLKPFIPTRNEIVNKSALIGLKILRSTHRYKSLNDLPGAINTGKLTTENIIKEMF